MVPHFLKTPAAAWRERLRRSPSLLVACDFDGTLAPIVPDPWAARVLPGGLRALSILARYRSGVAAAVVSGRGLADVRSRCPVDQLWLIGSHGNEIAAPPRRPLLAWSAPDFPPAALRQIESRAQAWPGVIVDPKTSACALHYRQAPHFAPRVEALAAQIAREYNLNLMPGKCLVELFCPEAHTKGQAIELLRSHLNADQVVYFGDDQTDETVFSLPPDWLIGVHIAPATLPDTPIIEADFDTRAAYWLRGPEEVARALRVIARLRLHSERNSHAHPLERAKI